MFTLVKQDLATLVPVDGSGTPSFVICLRPGVAVYRRKMYLFEMKCASGKWLLDRLSCVPRGDVN